MRYTVAKIVISINLNTKTLAAASQLAPLDTVDMPEFLACVGDIVAKVLNEYNLKPSVDFSNQVSQSKGEYSLYTVYNYIDSNSNIRLLLDIRLSNHSSKPDFAAFESRSAKKLKSNNFLDSADCKTLDVYCKKHQWGIQIYIGTSGDKTYSKPVTTFESAQRILEGNIAKRMEPALFCYKHQIKDLRIL